MRAPATTFTELRNTLETAAPPGPTLPLCASASIPARAPSSSISKWSSAGGRTITTRRITAKTMTMISALSSCMMAALYPRSPRQAASCAADVEERLTKGHSRENASRSVARVKSIELSAQRRPSEHTARSLRDLR
jgi:hypothetical protein